IGNPVATPLPASGRPASLAAMALLDRIELRPGPGYRPDAWYFGIPAIAQLRDGGLDPSPATVIVGENGSGKSTTPDPLDTRDPADACSAAPATRARPVARQTGRPGRPRDGIRAGASAGRCVRPGTTAPAAAGAARFPPARSGR